MSMRSLRWMVAAALLVALAIPPLAQASPNEDPLPRVPPGFAVIPYAPISGTPASLAFGPDTRVGSTAKRLYVADATRGQIVALDDVAGIGAQQSVFASGFSQPLGVVAAADGTIFVADSESRSGPFGTRTYGRVWRIRDANRDGVGDPRELVLRDLPNGRHNTNGMAFGPDGMLYVTNGNSTDDGVLGGQPEVIPWSGSVVRVNPNATDVSITALPQEDTLITHGMRNLFDLAFSPFDPTKLFIPTNGADDAGGNATPGLEDSDDVLYLTDVDDKRQKRDPVTGEPLFDENGNPILEPIIDDFGFPSCFYNEAKRGNLEPYNNPNPNVITRFGPCPIATVPRPVSTFGLHVSADGLAFQTTGAWGDAFRNDLFVAEFGNFFGNEVVGHKVVRVELDSTGEQVVRQSDFLSGSAPLDVTFDAAGSMFVADFGGAVYKIVKVVDVPNVVNVDMIGFQYVPQALVVPEGTIIRWRNMEINGVPHNVTGQLAVRSDGTQDDGEEINSALLSVGENHEYRFEKPGTWLYTCTVSLMHTAAMHGSITVVPAGS